MFSSFTWASEISGLSLRVYSSSGNHSSDKGADWDQSFKQSCLCNEIGINTPFSFLIGDHSSVCQEGCLLLFSCWVVSDSLEPHGLQHASFPVPSPSPRVFSNSCPLSRWCHPTISSSVVPFSSCLQSFPASGSFPKRVGFLHQIAKVLELQF